MRSHLFARAAGFAAALMILSAGLSIFLFCGVAEAKERPITVGQRPGEQEFSTQSFAPTYDARKKAYIEFCANRAGRTLLGAICAKTLGRETQVADAEVDYVEKRLKQREDCADFSAIRIAIALNFDRTLHYLTDEQRKRLERALLEFKYWIDEPGPDAMIYWTENHQIMFHSSEYLAGELFPDEVFTNDGKTGREHVVHAKALILKWIERRARWGFSEWDSNVYYGEDLPGLIGLANFAADPEVKLKAAMTVDLMLIDIGSDIFRGVYGTSHGRAYYDDVTSGRRDAIVTHNRIVWGVGAFASTDDFFDVPLTVGTYRPPDAVIALGRSFDIPEFLNKERHGIPIEKAPSYGLNYNDPESIVTFWGMGAYSQREVLNTTLKTADDKNLWNHPFFKDAVGARALIKAGDLSAMIKNTPIESDRTLLGEVNKVSFRTPDYMLSSALDYRPGTMGSQHHIWQATMSPDAVVFTTNPGSLEDGSDRTPTFWAGQNRLPRMGQYKNLLFAIYKIDTKKALGERAIYHFTHAFFPRAAFDEIKETKGWIFGRVGNAYIALYSARPYGWTDTGKAAGLEIKADGLENIWICLMGRRAVDGPFEKFIEKTAGADLLISDLNVTFDAPGVGRASFGWTGPLKVSGREIPMKDFPAVENPFVKSEFDSGLYVVTTGGKKLTLDFMKGVRKEN